MHFVLSYRRLARLAVVWLAQTGGFLLSGCQTNPLPAQSAAPAKTSLVFVDLLSFDKDLSGSLASSLPKVDVAFYDRITPSAIPERLQKWMASVESGGGNVKISPPPSSVTAKSPFLLLSAASSLWSANKMAKEAAISAQYRAAHVYDAEILLKLDDKGDTVVDKVVFNQRLK